MRERGLSIIFAALLLAASCAGGGLETSRQQTHLPGTLSAVTSDALAVVSGRKMAETLKYYDSASVLHKLDLSRIKASETTLSLCYNGALVPVLAIDVGKADSDSNSVFAGIVSQAEELGLHSAFFTPEEMPGKRGTLVLSPSDAQLTAVKRHIREGRSILDANDFLKALANAGVSDEFIVYRNAGASRLMPKGFLEQVFTRRSIANFLASSAEWTVLKPSGADCFSISAVVEQTGAHFLNLLEALPCSESRLTGIVPEGTDFALSLPLPQPEFRQAYEAYLDAGTRISGYRKRIAELKAESGKDPLKWEKELDIKEIAIVNTDAGTLLLARSGVRKTPDSDVAENPYKGFLQALYGSGFGSDDSCVATRDGWRIYGSDEAVRAFLESAPSSDPAYKWPSRKCRLAVCTPAEQIVWTKKSFRLWHTNL